VPVVSAPQPPEAAQAIARVAREKNAPLAVVGRDRQWQQLEASLREQRFSAWSTRDKWDKQAYTLPLLGRHQQINATTALAAVAQLHERGAAVTPEIARAGLERVHWPGRLEILSEHPWLVVDGAHNGGSMQTLSPPYPQRARMTSSALLDRCLSSLNVELGGSATNVNQCPHPT
jgi:dihydrofolate synthase/folylpolyglutamate synthase